MTWTSEAYSCIIPRSIQMDIKNMAAVENIGTSSGIKECVKENGV